MYDLILKGGEVFDGTGVECFNGDVAIKTGSLWQSNRLVRLTITKLSRSLMWLALWSHQAS